MDFLKKIRLKHAGFVIGVVLLLSGWIARIAAAFVMPEIISPTACFVMERVGYYLSGSSVFFLLGGILFWALISAKEDKDKPQEPLTEEQAEEQLRSELENAAYEIKSSIPFTAVYGFFSILITLSGASILFNSDRAFWMGASSLAFGLFFSQHYIRKSIRQFKWLSWYKKTGGKE